MKIGFIGTGNMASAIIKGIKSQPSLASFELIGYDAFPDAIKNCAKNFGIKPEDNIDAVVEKADIIFLGVKPKDSDLVLKEIAKNFNENKIIISMIVGLSIDKIANYFTIKNASKIIRMMPNLNAAVNQSATAWAPSWKMSKPEIKTIESILKGFGQIYQIPEKDFSKFAALAGSSPALILNFYQNFERIGQEMDLGYLDLKELFLNVFMGTLQNYQESELKPQEIINRVTSPGGTTIEGINLFNNRELNKIVNDAIAAIMKKETQIS